MVKSLDDRTCTCVGFWDKSAKVFDRVWDNGLLMKLQKNGIKGTLL
jgi:hypothetical protein